MSQADQPNISELLFLACHELRTSLRSIQVQSQLILKNEEHRSLAGLVIESSKRIELLADGLTSYAAALDIDQGSFQSVPMDVILRTVLARLDEELVATHARVTYGELPCVRGDPDRLADLFKNLLQNAVRHCGEAAPRIRVTAEKRPDGWLVAVTDNGSGIEAEYLESIFQPFERLQGRKREGPGLGLAISRAIVERHGGSIWAESEEGNGCRFRFTLPEP